MPIPAVVRAIIGNVWASAAGALKQDPADADPAITRADGYPASFSSTLTPEQETIQGRWNEFDSAIDDIYTSGVPFYDDQIDYPEHCITNEDGVLYRAVQANGPSTTAVTPSTDTAETTWARVSGEQGTPAAPNQPTATSPAPGTLAVSWNCPLDGGAAISEFTLQYRVAGGSWPGTEVNPTVPFRTLTGLTNGTAYEFRVRATNSLGDSAWSATGTGTPTASAPVGGNALALVATAGDSEVDLAWLEPDDGGSSITSYDVQWRTNNQAFSSSRQASVTTESYTRTGLTNNTTYHFRVRAVNSEGDSTWSNEAQATPSEGDHVVTTAGTTTFTWPWPHDKARVVVYGGGGGGANGGSTPGEAGSGGDSSVTHGSTTVTASGGAGGHGGYNPIQFDIRFASGNGGDGGPGPGVQGMPGRAGDVEIDEISGISMGDTLTIVVGAGGTGLTVFNPGDDGGPGSVVIVPIN